MRRRVDHCWTCVAKNGPFPAPEQAFDALGLDMRGGEARAKTCATKASGRLIALGQAALRFSSGA